MITATVACRPGARVYNANGGVFGGEGDVFLDDLRVAADLKSVTVTGAEDDDGTAAPWGVRAEAVCGRPHPNHQRRTATSGTDSAGTKTVSAHCPAGTTLHGIGGEINGGAGDVRLAAVDSLVGLEARVIAVEDQNGFAGDWSVTAYAVCGT